MILIGVALLGSIRFKPELEGNVQDLTGHNLAGLTREHLAEGGQAGSVTNHVCVTELVTSSLGQLVPNVEPITVVFVNALTSDLDLNILHKNVAEPVQPTEALTSLNGDGGKSHTEVHAVNQITVTADGAVNLLAPVSRAVEGLLNGLH